MAKTMTEEQKQRIRGANAARSATNAVNRSTGLVVGDFKLWRGDSYNIFVQHKEEELTFYPDVASALRSVFRRMSEPKGKADLGSVLATVAKAEVRIMEALGRSGAANLFDVAGESA